MSLDSKFNLACLPPTKNAAMQHSRRAYLQVQNWLYPESNIIATDWGWKLSQNGELLPIPTLDAPAPQKLLSLIACNCKGQCDNNRCECRKANLLCSAMCGKCQGESCANTPEIDVCSYDDEDSGDF